jgi:hypothetical protein
LEIELTQSDQPAGEPLATAPLILPNSPELDDLAARVLAQLQASVRFDRAAFCRVASVDELEIVAVLSAAHPNPPVGTIIPIDAMLGAVAARLGLVVDVDLHETQLPFDLLLARQGFRYALRVPIGAAPLAAAGVAVIRKEHAFSHEEIRATQEIADTAGAAVLALVSPGLP